MYANLICCALSTIGRDGKAITWSCTADLISRLRDEGKQGKILSASGQHEIQYTEIPMNKYMHNFIVFFFTSYALTKQVPDSSWKRDKEMRFAELAIIIIIFINCKCVDTRWQWSFYILHMHGLWRLITLDLVGEGYMGSYDVIIVSILFIKGMSRLSRNTSP
jgi:hypothetical protein